MVVDIILPAVLGSMEWYKSYSQKEYCVRTDSDWGIAHRNLERVNLLVRLELSDTRDFAPMFPMGKGS